MALNKYGHEIDLILLLSQSEPLTVKEIAERLEINPRSVYYYMEYLSHHGFTVGKFGTRYYLDPESDFFARINRNINLTQDEAVLLYEIAASSRRRSPLLQSILTKLARNYHIDRRQHTVSPQRIEENRNRLEEAIKERKLVILKKYSSGHSQTTADRVVEPFLMLPGEQGVRCFELRSKENRTFKLSRMSSVVVTDVDWAFEAEHRDVYTDVFLFSGDQRMPVKLRLGQLSCNLLVEEYPQAKPFVRRESPTSWIFKADVANYLGVGRFVLGLLDDVEILESEAFKQYVASKLAAFSQAQAALTK